MGISGTRSAVAVPLGALITVAALSHNLKITVSTVIFMIFLYFFFSFTQIGDGNQYIRKMRSAFHPSEDPSYIVRVQNREKIKTLMINKPIGYGLGLSKPGLYKSKERMPYPPDSFLVSIWVETGYIGLALFLAVHLLFFIWAAWVLLFKVKSKRVRGLITAWLGMAVGFFISAYVNDVMQYPNPIVVYTGFALCIAAPYIDKNECSKTHQELENKNIE
jgi:positive regulator of sigma E activity